MQIQTGQINMHGGAPALSLFIVSGFTPFSLHTGTMLISTAGLTAFLSQAPLEQEPSQLKKMLILATTTATLFFSHVYITPLLFPSLLKELTFETLTPFFMMNGMVQCLVCAILHPVKLPIPKTKKTISGLSKQALKHHHGNFNSTNWEEATAKLFYQRCYDSHLPIPNNTLCSQDLRHLPFFQLTLPQTKNEVESLSENQLFWILRFVAAHADEWDKLEFAVQVALNKRFLSKPHFTRNIYKAFSTHHLTQDNLKQLSIQMMDLVKTQLKERPFLLFDLPKSAFTCLEDHSLPEDAHAFSLRHLNPHQLRPSIAKKFHKIFTASPNKWRLFWKNQQIAFNEVFKNQELSQFIVTSWTNS